MGFTDEETPKKYHREYYQNDDGVKAIDIIERCHLHFDLGNVLKYLMRAGKKTPSKTSDYQKASWYIEHLFNARSLLREQFGALEPYFDKSDSIIQLVEDDLLNEALCEILKINSIQDSFPKFEYALKRLYHELNLSITAEVRKEIQTMDNLKTPNGNKPTVEDVLTKVNGLWWLIDMFVVFARSNISYEPPMKQYFVYEKILKDLDYVLTNREVLNRSFETFRSLYGKDAKLEFTSDEVLNRALKRLLVEPESMNNPFEFQDTLNDIASEIKRVYDQFNRELNEYELVKLKKTLDKED